tara:strand:+ start:9026 stop:9415 length:390 start_codon:yes stop_codon:yes gene_type:complete
MANHGFWHPTLGYWETISDPSDDIVAAYESGTIEVPVRPTRIHTWNTTTNAWNEPSTAELDALKAEDIRSERDYRLQDGVDRVVSNPLRWAGISTSKQDEIKAYRQALLDVPTQVGFPTSVTWPDMFTL